MDPQPIAQLWIDWLWIAGTLLVWLFICGWRVRRWKRSPIMKFDESMLRYPI